MNATGSVVMRVVGEQARTWLIANREHGLSEEHRYEFLAWLQASPLHVRAYLSLAKLLVDLRAVMAEVDVPTEELIEAARNEPADNVAALPPRPSAWSRIEAESQAALRRTHWFLAVAAAVSTLAVGALSWWSIMEPRSHKEYRTAHGEQRLVRLEDGSVLHINSDSIVLVKYTQSERGVAMKRGQAFFKVARDKTRPFRVRAGSTEVVVLGTEFDVRRLSEDVVVTVVEGVVAVAKIDESASARSFRPPPVQISAGQQMRVGSGSVPTVHEATEVRSVDVRPSVAWVQQKIILDRETLEKVAAEFNRYGTTQLVIEDSQAATLRISGVFNAYDLESFVLYLESVNGLQVRRDLNRIRVALERGDGEAL